MNTRLTVVVALAIAVAAGSPALAAKPKKLPAPKPLVTTDPAGDANGINSQGGLVPVPSQSGQGQRTAADILSVALGRLDNGKAVTGLTATFVLSAAPDQGTIYRLQMSAPGCKIFWLSYNVPIGGPISANIQDDCTTAGTSVVTPVTATVKDKTIKIAVPLKALNKKITLGTALTGMYGESKGHAYTGVRNPTAPTIDETTIATATYKIGS